MPRAVYGELPPDPRLNEPWSTAEDVNTPPSTIWFACSPSPQYWPSLPPESDDQHRIANPATKLTLNVRLPRQDRAVPALVGNSNASTLVRQRERRRAPVLDTSSITLSRSSA